MTGYVTIAVVYLIIVGLSSLVFGLAIHYLVQKNNTGNVFIKFTRVASVWALSELLVSWLIAVVWIGKNGSWDTVFPFASFSTIIINTPFRFLSRFVGFYGLSGVIVAASSMVLTKSTRHYAQTIWLSILILTVLGWGLFTKTNGASVTTTIVAEKLGRPQKLLLDDAQLVILPEYGLDQTTSKNISRRLLTSTSSAVYFVGSKQQSSSGDISNSLTFGSTGDGFLLQEKKTRLIPGGEYLPYVVSPIINRFDPSSYADFQVERAIVKGIQPIKPFYIDKDLVLGSGACSSIISTQDYRHLTRQGATILTNSASLDIFAGSRLFSWQQRSLAKFMAVANSRSFVQSANDGDAYALNNNGDNIAEINPVDYKKITSTTNHRITPYTTFGEWLPIVGIMFLLSDGFNQIKNRKPKKLG